MKRSLLFLSFIVISLSVNAQITINQGDFPVPGEVWVELSDGRYGVHTITTGGGPQSWDYSNAFVVDDTTVLGFITPSSTPPGWASSFPNSTMALYELLDSTAVFLRAANDGLYVDGFYDITGGNPLTVLDFDPDILLIPVPFTNGSTRTDIAGFEVEQPAVPPNPGFLIKFFIVKEFEGDAYGSLITPAATYPNVLRAKTIEYSIDSTFIDILGTGNYSFLNANGPSDTTITITFLQKGPNTIVMEIEEDPASPGTSVSARYYNPNLVSLNDLQQEDRSVVVYPNPVTGNVLNVEVGFDGAELLRIYDSKGSLLTEENIRGIRKYELNTSQFAPGIYYYEVNSGTGVPVRDKFIIQ
jgi:hypothetical protein